MQAEARHDFNPSDPSTELAFQRGDKLVILNYGDPVQWYNAVKDGQQGLVPGNYIHIDKPSWFMGRLSRAKAEKILQANMVEGAFLIRLSESAPTEFSLSVKCDNSVQHYRILKNNHLKYFLWSETFDSLNELVEYYRETSVSRSSQVFLRDLESENQFVVEALYDFEADQESETELAFKKGDLITVTDTTDVNWWGGRIGNRNGFFPRTYVRKGFDPADIVP